MNRLLRRAAALCAAATATSLLAMTPVSAETIAYVDARQDAREVVFDESDPDARPRTRISDVQQNLDLSRARFSNGRRAFTASLRFTDLTPTSRLNVHGVLRTRASGPMGYTAILAWLPKRESARFALFDGESFDRVRCGVSHRIDFGADTVTLRLPQTCFDSPRWIRAAFIPNDFAPGETRDEIRFLYDHPFLDRPAQNPGLTPRLFAGKVS